MLKQTKGTNDEEYCSSCDLTVDVTKSPLLWSCKSSF